MIGLKTNKNRYLEKGLKHDISKLKASLVLKTSKFLELKRGNSRDFHDAKSEIEFLQSVIETLQK